MKRHCGMRLLLSIVLLGLAAGLLAAAAAPASVKFTRVRTGGVGTFPSFGMARTGNGTLHLVYQTNSGSTLNGLGTRSISPAGALGPQVQALSGWDPSRPGLVALPNGTLETVFGAISPGLVSGIWGVSSSNGGAGWTAPADVKSGPLESLAYASDITMQLTGATPVLTVPQAGNLVVQQGLGPGSPTRQINTAADGALGDVDSAVDAAGGEVVASWSSLAGNGGDYIQGVAPTVGVPQKAPGMLKNELVISGRDTGPGVFAAYTTDGSRVRLLRYGGGSVAVGRLPAVTTKVLGTATGIGGRIWVMWGDENGGVGVTRSNTAVTRFEPIQHVNPNAFSLYRLSGDGRLGPLDLFADEIPTSKTKVPPAGSFYARVLPELSAAVSVKKIKNKSGQVVAYKLTAKVTDAGDPLSGATVAAAGKTATSNAKGLAAMKLPGTLSGSVTVTLTHPGYRGVKKGVKL
jgi:hypothetical protein